MASYEFFHCARQWISRILSAPVGFIASFLFLATSLYQFVFGCTHLSMFIDAFLKSLGSGSENDRNNDQEENFTDRASQDPERALEQVSWTSLERILSRATIIR